MSGSGSRAKAAAAVLVVVIAVAGTLPAARPASAADAVPVGGTHPDVTLPDQHGTTITLSELAGKIVVLDFGADWCASSRTLAEQVRGDLAAMPESVQFAYLPVLTAQGDAPSDAADAARWAELYTAAEGTAPSVLHAAGGADATVTAGFDDLLAANAVGAVPTLVFLGPDRQVLERIVGVPSGDGFVAHRIREWADAFDIGDGSTTALSDPWNVRVTFGGAAETLAIDAIDTDPTATRVATSDTRTTAGTATLAPATVGLSFSGDYATKTGTIVTELRDDASDGADFLHDGLEMYLDTSHPYRSVLPSGWELGPHHWTAAPGGTVTLLFADRNPEEHAWEPKRIEYGDLTTTESTTYYLDGDPDGWATPAFFVDAVAPDATDVVGVRFTQPVALVRSFVVPEHTGVRAHVDYGDTEVGEPHPPGGITLEEFDAMPWGSDGAGLSQLPDHGITGRSYGYVNASRWQYVPGWGLEPLPLDPDTAVTLSLVLDGLVWPDGAARALAHDVSNSGYVSLRSADDLVWSGPAMPPTVVLETVGGDTIIRVGPTTVRTLLGLDADAADPLVTELTVAVVLEPTEPPDPALVWANGENYAVAEGATLGVPAGAGVLSNDSQASLLGLDVHLLDPPDHGTLSLSVDGAFTYTPDAGFDGEDSFRYHSTNGTYSSVPASARITVDAADAVPLTLGPLRGPSEPVAAGTTVTVTTDLTGGGAGEPYTATVDWGDGTTAGPATLDGTTFSATHTYRDPVVADVVLTVTDAASAQETAGRLTVVVYDPTAGFVTGAGAIWSPLGAIPSSSDEGEATFAFVSRYKKHAAVPDGHTDFRFAAGGLSFVSATYDWLVVNKNDSTAQFRGTGTLNGVEGYRFMLWAGDRSPDTFRIRIWSEDQSGEIVAYDNGAHAPLARGSILVQSKQP